MVKFRRKSLSAQLCLNLQVTCIFTLEFIVKKKEKEFTGIQKDWGTSKMQAKDNFNNLLQKIKR